MTTDPRDRLILAMADRIAIQAELLARCAERRAASLLCPVCTSPELAEHEYVHDPDGTTHDEAAA